MPEYWWYPKARLWTLYLLDIHKIFSVIISMLILAFNSKHSCGKSTADRDFCSPYDIYLDLYNCDLFVDSCKCNCCLMRSFLTKVAYTVTFQPCELGFMGHSVMLQTSLWWRVWTTCWSLSRGKVSIKEVPLAWWHAKRWKYEDGRANLQRVHAVPPGCLQVLFCPSNV